MRGRKMEEGEGREMEMVKMKVEEVHKNSRGRKS